MSIHRGNHDIGHIIEQYCLDVKLRAFRLYPYTLAMQAQSRVPRDQIRYSECSFLRLESILRQRLYLKT